MLARVLTLRFNSLMDGLDDAPLREFIKDKEVLAIREHFFMRNELPYLALLVTYNIPVPQPNTAPAQQAGNQPGRREESWREWVAEADIPLFNALRDWRAERSKQDGLPPYVICTNRQLAAMIADRPQTLAKLGQVEGFGKNKLERYGKEILTVLARAESKTSRAAGQSATPAAEEATLPTPAGAEAVPQTDGADGDGRPTE
jgi:hypothetical protein